ncbi:MAG: PIG-L family deacetylase [Bryobacterales bacterium]|nr:PIG-L family deacetylase [Acidobacteriota bacterium]MCB9383304.1 PIG-L family deacetylase [Bryobacterales bacterium]
MRAPVGALCLVLWTALPALSLGLPKGELPPGKTFLLIQPHHDDHSWEYGHGGLVAKLVDAGWQGTYVRVSNDEKDGHQTWAENDQRNFADASDAVRSLGVERIVSLNWRNDHMSSLPILELRAQLILLIRKLRPDVVMAYNPWGRYDRNPDHRFVAEAVGQAVWLSGMANVHPEYADLGLEPYRVPYLYFSQRSDYGKGYEPNVAIELTEAQVQRKAVAYRLHANVRVSAAAGRAILDALDARGLEIPELKGLSDEDAHKKLQEWRMFSISAKRGRENGLKYAEVFYFLDEWRAWPALADYLETNARPAP